MQSSEKCNPVLVEVIRKDEVESIHRGSALVVDATGKRLFSIGDVDRHIYPRSALKFFQAIPLVESGAADQYELTEREIALSCASHNAEKIHTETVISWLQRLGLGCDDLECGPTLPLSPGAAHALIAAGESPTRVHQNCSGKHSGMLTMCKHLGAETRGYSEYRHPSQAAWMKTMGEIMQIDIFSLPWERDGCGLPALYMPMARLAFGFARYADMKGIETPRARAMARILQAIIKYPEMIAGSKRCCTAVIDKTGGKVIVKTGAEGVFGGCIPERGIGFALKVDDGATRASEVAMGALLKKLGLLDQKTAQALTPWFEPAIINSQGKVTGKVIASSAWR